MPKFKFRKFRRWKLWLVGLLVFMLVIILVYRPVSKFLTSSYADEYYLRLQEPVLGILNRTNDTTRARSLNLSHGSIIWKSTALCFDERALEKLLANGPAIITVETWLKSPQSGDNVLTAVYQGKFDKPIEQLGYLIAQCKFDVYVRFDTATEK